MPNPFSYNILVTLDRNYLPVLRVMLHSLSQSDPEGEFTVYAVHNSLTEQDLQRLHTLFPRVHPVSVKVPEGLLAGAPVSDRYPTEMYSRLFAAHYLPQQLDRILYLDPDLTMELASSCARHWEKSHLFAARQGMPVSLAKELALTAELETGESVQLAELHDQHQRLVTVPLPQEARIRALRVEIRETWGGRPPVIYGIRVY